ncbi:hypothetical protein [Pelomonas cellulosilytica]|uniref:Uncharacterized protein n=1 Tax=Pelomonas cellulosilytica TaxID=2906762 RepID=A0ABS8XRY0_9BURK|nr:hypothetical protein [Pelomonas sp. P8]MCE4555476.1 hypothetical protein [Pelomonas sp. P8]
MNNSSSPLEHLAAFAITFACGMVTAVAMGAYGRFISRKARADLQKPAEREA